MLDKLGLQAKVISANILTYILIYLGPLVTLEYQL